MSTGEKFCLTAFIISIAALLDSLLKMRITGVEMDALAFYLLLSVVIASWSFFVVRKEN